MPYCWTTCSAESESAAAVREALKILVGVHQSLARRCQARIDIGGGRFDHLLILLYQKGACFHILKCSCFWQHITFPTPHCYTKIASLCVHYLPLQFGDISSRTLCRHTRQHKLHNEHADIQVIKNFDNVQAR